MSSTLQRKTLLLFFDTMDWLKTLAAQDSGAALDVLSMMTRELQVVSDQLADSPVKPVALRVIRSP